MLTRAVAGGGRCIIMIHNAVAMSYEDMTAFVRSGIPDNVRIISITDLDADLIFQNESDRVLTFAFDDVEPTDMSGVTSSPAKYRLFSRADASRIVQAIQRWHAEDTPLSLMVNCMAGVSRSAAVCEFAYRVCGINSEIFKRDNPIRFPNGHVLRLLVRESNSRTRPHKVLSEDT